jgi:hypothetical protein
MGLGIGAILCQLIYTSLPSLLVLPLVVNCVGIGGSDLAFGYWYRSIGCSIGTGTTH